MTKSSSPGEVDSAPPTVSSRLDRIPVLTRSHRNWLILLGLFYIFDTMDLAVAAYTAPAWRTHWGASIGAIGLVTAATFVGMAVGALIGGRLADRFGRRPVILGSMLFMSVPTLAIAFTTSIEQVTVLRVFAGIGLQSMIATIMVLTSELLPAVIRGRYVALVVTVGLVAVPLAAIVSTFVVPLSSEAWRWMFIFTSLGALLVIPAWRLLPESPRWLIAHGREAQASTIVDALEDEARAIIEGPLPEPGEAPVPVLASPRDLLHANQLRNTLVGMATMVFMVLILYGFSQWIPTLLVDRGYSSTAALVYATALASVGAIGSFTAYFFIDRWERKVLISLLGLGIAVLALAFGFSFSAPAVLFFGLGLVCSALIQAAMAVAFVYIPELFPTGLRGLGTGASHSVGRCAGIGGALIVPFLYGSFGFPSVYIYVAGAGVCLAVIVGYFGSRTKGRALS